MQCWRSIFQIRNDHTAYIKSRVRADLMIINIDKHTRHKKIGGDNQNYTLNTIDYALLKQRSIKTDFEI